jgi:hypothetical protein
MINRDEKNPVLLHLAMENQGVFEPAWPSLASLFRSSSGARSDLLSSFRNRQGHKRCPPSEMLLDEMFHPMKSTVPYIYIFTIVFSQVFCNLT